MAKKSEIKYGICTNSECMNYGQSMEIPEDGNCPMCHTPLKPESEAVDDGGLGLGGLDDDMVGGGQKPKSKLPLIIGGIVGALVVLGTALFFLLSGDKIPEATKLTLNKDVVTLKVGQTDQLTVTVEPAEAQPQLQWQASKSEAVSVINGTVTAMKAGKGKVKVSVVGNDAVQAICEYTVVEDEVDMKTLVINEDPITLKPGGNQRLTVTFTPDDQTETISWQSSDEAIAKVSPMGKVDALKPGSVIITAKSDRTGVEATATVTVEGNNTSTGGTPVGGQGDGKSTGGGNGGKTGGGSISVLNGSGSYVGDSQGGVPHGNGIIYIKRTCTVKGETAHAGDKIEGVFREGWLNMGTLLTKDGDAVTMKDLKVK